MAPVFFLFCISLIVIVMLCALLFWAIYENAHQPYAVVDYDVLKDVLPKDPKVSIHGLSPDPIGFSPEFLFPPTDTNQIKMVFSTKNHTDLLKILGNASEGKVNDYNFPFQTINVAEDLMPLLFDIYIQYVNKDGKTEEYKLENASISTIFTGSNETLDTIVLFDFTTIYKKNNGY